MKISALQRMLCLVLVILMACIIMPADPTSTVHAAALGESGESSGKVAALGDGLTYDITTTVTLNGAPVANVQVYLYSVYMPSYYYDYGRSNQNGQLTLTGIEVGEYYFVVDSDEYQYSGKAQTFMVPGTVPEIQLRGKSSVSTQVTFQGVPQPYVAVELRSNERDIDAQRRTTDFSGNVTFTGLDDADYYFYVSASSMDPYAIYNGSALGKLFAVPGDHVPDIQLSPAYQVSTRVTLNGAPVANAHVTLFMENEAGYMESYAYKSTDANGDIVFSHVPSSNKCYFYVSKSDGNYAHYSGNTKGLFFSIPSGQPIPEIELDLGISFTTQVLLNGAPVSGAYVQLSRQDGRSEFIMSISDSSGMLTYNNLSEDPSNYYFNAWYYEGVHAQYHGKVFGEFFSLTTPPTTLNVEEGETYRIRITRNGAPVEDMAVSLWYAPAMQTIGGKHYATEWDHITMGYTDNQGMIALTNILPGYWYGVDVYDNTSRYNPIYYYNSWEDPLIYFDGQMTTIEIGSGSSGGGPTNRRSGGGGGGGGSRSPARMDGDTSVPARTATSAATPVEQAAALELVEKAVQTSQSENATTATVRLINKGELSLDVMKAMAAASSLPLWVNADSLAEQKIDVRITFDPANATKDIVVAASTVSDKAAAVQAYFKKWFANDLFVVSFEQEQSFGMPVQLAVKSPSELDTSNLAFYSYDRTEGTYQQIQATYTVDGNGYIHFSTDQAGFIVISDQPLRK